MEFECKEYGVKGTCFYEPKEAGYAVYDNSQNFLGYIRKNGNFALYKLPNNYTAVFLKSAKEFLVNKQLIPPQTVNPQFANGTMKENK